VQHNGRSVQEELGEGSARLHGVPVRATGAGRTDAGVHARGQVAPSKFERELPLKAWTACLNALLRGPGVRSARRCTERVDAPAGRAASVRYTILQLRCALRCSAGGLEIRGPWTSMRCAVPPPRCSDA